MAETKLAIRPAKAKKKSIEYFSSYFKTIVIPFDQFFGAENAEYSDFMLSLVSKKSYSKLAPLICAENNAILNRNHDLAMKFMFAYLVLKRGVDTNRYNSDSQAFISEMVSTLINDEFIREVQAYVAEQYTTNVDAEMDLENHRYDKGTTFTDRHFKAMYTISAITRLVIPICTHFVHVSTSMNAKKFFYDAFIVIFGLVQKKEDTDIYSKLHTYIFRAVQKTRNVDKAMWSDLQVFAMTPESAVEEALKKMITDVFPKFNFAQNIMNLITVVIRSFVTWTLRKEHPFSIYTLMDSEGQGGDDDSVTSEADIFDSYNTKRDETVLFLRKHFANDTIIKIMARERVTVTNEELQYYRFRKVKFHALQTFCVFQAFAYYFGGSENLHGCNKEQYLTLVIALTKMMRNVGIHELPKFILGERQNYNYRRISKSFDNLLLNDPLYKHIVDTKYGAIRGILERKNFIRNTIVMVINNNYAQNEFGNPHNGQPIEKDEVKIRQDVLQFFNLLVV